MYKKIMKSLKQSFWGYRASDVEASLTGLEDEARRLRKDNEAKRREIDELTYQLKRAKADEELIREAVIDAKELSRRLVRDAKEQATTMLFEAEQEVQERFDQFDRSTEALTRLKEQLEHQRDELEAELLALIDRYREGIRLADNGDFDAISTDMRYRLEQMQELAQRTQQAVALKEIGQPAVTVPPAAQSFPSGVTPLFNHQTAPPEPPQSQPEPPSPPTDNWGDDVPVYSFY